MIPVTHNGWTFGYVYSTPYGWFANPNRSEIQAIPCTSYMNAYQTVMRLGGGMKP